MPGGARGSRAAEEYVPDPGSGARGVEVPEDDQLTEPGAAGSTGGATWDAPAGDLETGPDAPARDPDN